MRDSNAKAKPARKLRAVVDTNIFLSDLFGKGTLAAELQDLWIAKEGQNESFTA